MKRKQNLKTLDTNFFEYQNKAKSWFIAKKYGLNSVSLSLDNAEILVCNKTSCYDKFFLSASIETPHVFLKDEIISKFYTKDGLSKQETELLSSKITELLTSSVSVIIFPEKHQTIFGDYQTIPENITSFIKSFNKKVRFLSLIGTYFIKPIWSEYENKCEIKLEQRFCLTSQASKSLNDAEYNEKFNQFMPSSASTYMLKYPLFLRGKRPAESLESIIYVCPSCKKLFSLYSEYACVKCANCGTAFEFSSTGEISLTKMFNSLDSAKEFQKSVLKKFNFENKLIVGYKNIFLIENETQKEKSATIVSFLVYENKAIIKSVGQEICLNYKDIIDLNLCNKNILKITCKSNENYMLQGKHRENFYILYDLISNLNQNKKTAI